MKKILFTLIMAFSSLALAQATTSKTLDICIKGYKNPQAKEQCDITAASMRSINQNGVRVDMAVCSPNQLGMGQGFFSQQCALYDYVLRVNMQISM